MQSKVMTSRQQKGLSWNQRRAAIKPKPCRRMSDWLNSVAWKDKESMNHTTTSIGSSSSDSSDSPNRHPLKHSWKEPSPSSPSKPMNHDHPLPPMKVTKTEHTSPSGAFTVTSTTAMTVTSVTVAAAVISSSSSRSSSNCGPGNTAAVCDERTTKTKHPSKTASSEKTSHADANPIIITIDDDEDNNTPQFHPGMYLPDGECIEERFAPSKRYYDLPTFETHFNQAVEWEFQKSTCQLEQSNWIKKANRSLDKADTRCQEQAQYGRIFCKPFQTILNRILCINPETDVYLDFGHGLGNTVLQAASMCQCDARGIEVDSQRNTTAMIVYEGLQFIQKQCRESDMIDYTVGIVDLRLGSLSDPQFHDFITKPSPGKKCIKAFCNNFNGVFGDKSSKRGQKYHLDNYIAGLFASMPPGSMLVTLHPIDLGLPQSYVLERRNLHGMSTPDRTLASFFECETISLGLAKDCVSWAGSSNTSTIELYKYTRLSQSNTTESVFLCPNPYCEFAAKGTSIPATQFDCSRDGQGIETPRVVMNRCECGGDRSSRRMQNKLTVQNPKVDNPIENNN